MVNPLESSSEQQNEESIIPPDVLGSKENPYEPIGGMDVHTVISNMWYQVSKFEADKAYFNYWDKQYSIDQNFGINLIKDSKEMKPEDLDEKDKLDLKQMRKWTTEVKNKI
jgi:hypothetical protein